MQAPLNDTTCLPNIMKIYQAYQKLLVGDTGRQTGDLITLLSFSNVWMHDVKINDYVALWLEGTFAYLRRLK
jgi:hypothetical protein